MFYIFIYFKSIFLLEEIVLKFILFFKYKNF